MKTSWGTLSVRSFRTDGVLFSRMCHILRYSFLAAVFAVSSVRAADFKREIIYQIVTDRFFNGSSANDNPAQSAGLFDSSQTQWFAYWGGDLAGIQAKMSYLSGMGITAIWISPPVDNENLSLGTGINGPYHGYHARDFKRIEEHYGSSANTWTEFDNLVTAAHNAGIKVIVDFAPNHSNPNNVGEQGALYDNGTLLGRFTSDTNGYFHHNPEISDYNDRYQVQYYTLSSLADLNQENATIDKYLKDSAIQFLNHGADGFRVDAIKHTTWGWLYSFANTVYTSKNVFMFGEWIEDSTSTSLYHDLYKFTNKSGMSVLDFPLYNAIDNVFARNQAFSQIDSTLTQEQSNFRGAGDLVTFIDNHDRQRFLSINNNQNRLHEALAFVLTSRGIPSIYYGTEQYLHNDTNGGNDPYNRPQMTSFSTTTAGYTLIKKLADLRRANVAIPYGTSQERWISNDVYIFERAFAGSVALIAINKNDTTSTAITGLFTSMPAGTYADVLTNQFGGQTITVTGTTGTNPVGNITLPAHSISVWSYINPSTAGPSISTPFPAVAQPGIKVSIPGTGFGTGMTVLFGTTAATIASQTATELVVTVPAVANGTYTVTVRDSAGRVSNGQSFTVLGAKLIPVTFTVNNASPTSIGDYIFLAGNTVELGSWGTTFDTAAGPMLAPNYPNWFLNVSLPAGQTVQFKFIKIAANGTVTWENGTNHSYTVPTTGTGFVTVGWQY